jgi:ankyrin repeat protein
LLLAHEFFEAIAKGEVAIVRTFLERDPSFANAVVTENPSSRSGGTESSLDVAAQYQQLEVIKALVDFGADVNALNNSQQSPLHMALSRSPDVLSMALVVEQRTSEMWKWRGC